MFCFVVWKWTWPNTPETFSCKIFWSLIQLWTFHKKKKQNKKVKKWCDWQKKNLSNYCTQSSTSPDLSDWWLHGFLNVFCVVDHSSVTSCTFPITLCPYKKYRGVMVCTSNDFLFPTSAPCQQHTDSWHHNSLCVCWKRLQRAREKLSPYFTL